MIKNAKPTHVAQGLFDDMSMSASNENVPISIFAKEPVVQANEEAASNMAKSV